MLKAQICHLVIFFRVVDLNDEAAAQIRTALGDQGGARRAVLLDVSDDGDAGVFPQPGDQMIQGQGSEAVGAVPDGLELGQGGGVRVQDAAIESVPVVDADQLPVAGPGEVQLQQPEAVFVGMFQRLQTVAARHSLRGDAAGVEDHQGGVELLRLSGDGRKGDGQARRSREGSSGGQGGSEHEGEDKF